MKRSRPEGMALLSVCHIYKCVEWMQLGFFHRGRPGSAFA